MLIRTVRAHQPVSLLLIPLLGVLLWLPGFLHPSPPAEMVYMPLYAPVDAFLRLNPAFSVVAGFLLSISGAFLLNYVIYQHQVLTKKSWLPALLYIVLSACTPGLLWLHPQVIAGPFLLGMLHLLLGTYRADKAFGAVFKAGFLLGIAALFYLPALVFLLFAIIVLILLRPFIWREWIIFIIGVTIPWLYAGAWFFWTGAIDEITQRVLIAPIVHRDFFLKLPYEYYALTAVTGFLLMVAIGRFVAGAGTSTLKTKKGVSVMVWFLVFSLLAIAPAQNYAVAGFIFALYPVSLFISNYFLLARRTWIAETIFIMLLLSIALTYYLK